MTHEEWLSPTELREIIMLFQESVASLEAQVASLTKPSRTSCNSSLWTINLVRWLCQSAYANMDINIRRNLFMVLCFCAGLLLLFPAKSLCEQGWVTVRKGIGRTAGQSGVLFFSDSFHGWAVGMMSPGQFLQEGVNVKGILFTQDGGHTWDEVFIEGFAGQVVNEELKSLNAVYFLNAHEGWIGGSNAIAPLGST